MKIEIKERAYNSLNFDATLSGKNKHLWQYLSSAWGFGKSFGKSNSTDDILDQKEHHLYS